MVGPIDVKRKGSASVGYRVQYVALTFDLTHDLDLGYFNVKFRNSSISGIVGLIDVKWKRGELFCNLILGRLYDLALWPHPWPWPRVEISRSESEIALSQEWDGRLTWNEKDASHPFMTMTLTSMTMVGWADVPYSDWGDFRRRRAVDISSCWDMLYLSVLWHSDAIWQCYRKCNILGSPTDHPWLMIGWPGSVLGVPPINYLLRPWNQLKLTNIDIPEYCPLFPSSYNRSLWYGF